MAYVTQIVISCSLNEHVDANGELDLVREIINPFLLHWCNATLRNVSKYAGGRHRPLALLYMGTFNHLPTQEFLDLIDKQDWAERLSVYVLARADNQLAYSFYVLQNDCGMKKLSTTVDTSPVVRHG